MRNTPSYGSLMSVFTHLHVLLMGTQREGLEILFNHILYLCSRGAHGNCGISFTSGALENAFGSEFRTVALINLSVVKQCINLRTADMAVLRYPMKPAHRHVLFTQHPVRMSARLASAGLN